MAHKSLAGNAPASADAGKEDNCRSKRKWGNGKIGTKGLASSTKNKKFFKIVRGGQEVTRGKSPQNVEFAGHITAVPKHVTGGRKDKSQKKMETPTMALPGSRICR